MILLIFLVVFCVRFLFSLFALNFFFFVIFGHTLMTLHRDFPLIVILFVVIVVLIGYITYLGSIASIDQRLKVYRRVLWLVCLVYIHISGYLYIYNIYQVVVSKKFKAKNKNTKLKFIFTKEQTRSQIFTTETT